MFDLKEELLDKIHLGEDSVLELKSLRFRGSKIVGPTRENLADELAAFANANDGVLLLGVDDKTREIEGIPIEKLDAAENYVREICNDSVNPPLSIKIVRLMLPDKSGEKTTCFSIRTYFALPATKIHTFMNYEKESGFFSGKSTL